MVLVSRGRSARKLRLMRRVWDVQFHAFEFESNELTIRAVESNESTIRTFESNESNIRKLNRTSRLFARFKIISRDFS